ncbi:helix-turn-helix domain-containing protein [Shouchella patagoniensis]|uniref:helix-turn-helix domain-containing protein n=1 Tax=Shouchella patagoniensis TaxID=228576 RepID=UPI000995598C|nr:helix-turn-helix domain-containing protein [Shouchella patagoniensis]
MNFFSYEKEKKNEIFEKHRNEFMKWRNELQELNKPFFMIPTDFKHIFLKDISGGALKLYLFLGFHAKYHTGESWYSLEQVGSFFDKDPRTIANWFKELEELGLVFRGQKGIMMKANTFLKPYGFSFYEVENEKNTSRDVFDHIEENFEYTPSFGLMLNYSLKDFTFIQVSKKGSEFLCSCFYNFDTNEIKILRDGLIKRDIRFDNFDIDSPLQRSTKNVQVIYNYLMRYLDEKTM